MNKLLMRLMGGRMRSEFVEPRIARQLEHKGWVRFEATGYGLWWVITDAGRARGEALRVGTGGGR